MHTKYYNGARLLNADCPINFSLGNRSAGKSFYWKRYVIRNFINKGRKFLYLRRYENEIDETISSFFDDISPKFEGYGMKIVKNNFVLIKYDENGEIENEQICGYARSLSKGFKLKSIPLEDVDTIFFDEFIPEDLKYLKPSFPSYEPEMLLSIYLTVARGYGKVIRPEVKIICVANAITLYNPFFTYFEIDLTQVEHTVKNFVYAEIITQTEIAEEIRQSKFGQILERTNYGVYALENVAYRDIESNIAKHPKNAKLWFCVYIYTWYSCFRDSEGKIYFCETYDKTAVNKYKFVELETTEQIPWFKGDIVNIVRNLVYQDKVYYANMKVKSSIAGLFTPKTF